MSEQNEIMQRVQAQAIAEVVKEFIPQLFSPPEIVTGNAEDSGGNDIWMMTNMPPEVLLPLNGLMMIATVDKRDEIKEFVERTLRALKGIHGFASKQGENIAIGMLGGGKRGKIVKKPNVFSRTFTNRSWRRKAEDEGAQIVE